MDIQAAKPVTSVASSPAAERGRSAEIQGSTGKDVPREPAPPPAHLDPAATKQSQELAAALARRMNAFLNAVSRDLDFQVDVDAGSAVLTVRDAAGNIVRKIPGEEAMQMLRRHNVESGTLIDSLV
jgi:uncharacterized FlaG/YvyC family protein